MGSWSGKCNNREGWNNMLSTSPKISERMETKDDGGPKMVILNPQRNDWGVKIKQWSKVQRWSINRSPNSWELQKSQMTKVQTVRLSDLRGPECLEMIEWSKHGKRRSANTGSQWWYDHDYYKVMNFSTNFKDCKGPFPPSEACRQLCLRVNLVHAGRHLSFMQNLSTELC